MVWRFLYRYLLNDKVVDKLAESYPIRRAAQWVVYFVNRTRAIEGEKFFNSNNEKVLKSFAQLLEARLKEVRDKLEQKSKKY